MQKTESNFFSLEIEFTWYFQIWLLFSNNLQQECGIWNMETKHNFIWFMAVQQGQTIVNCNGLSRSNIKQKFTLELEFEVKRINLTRRRCGNTNSLFSCCHSHLSCHQQNVTAWKASQTFAFHWIMTSQHQIQMRQSHWSSTWHSHYK